MMMKFQRCLILIASILHSGKVVGVGFGYNLSLEVMCHPSQCHEWLYWVLCSMTLIFVYEWKKYFLSWYERLNFSQWCVLCISVSFVRITLKLSIIYSFLAIWCRLYMSDSCNIFRPSSLGFVLLKLINLNNTNTQMLLLWMLNFIICYKDR